jgi:CspA family cold shock protein
MDTEYNSILTKGAAIVKIQGSTLLLSTLTSHSASHTATAQLRPFYHFHFLALENRPRVSENPIAGIVQWFDPEKGYGFIRPSTEERDAFVHMSAVEELGLNTLHEGQTVEYDLVTIRGKTSAVNLKVER